jgi:hypothetical protein
MALAPSGCGPERAEQTPLPTLAEIAPHPMPVDSSEAEASDDQSAAAPEAGHDCRLVVEQLFFPRALDQVTFALNLLDPPVIDDALLRALHENGFGIAEVDRRHLAMLRANLPDPLGIRQQQIAGASRWVPITLVNRITAPQAVQFVARDGSTQHMRIGRGQYQLLLRCARDEQGKAPVMLEGLPHHFEPRITLLPRPLEEQMLDGRSFESLRLNCPLEQDRVLLLWCRADLLSGETVETDDEAVETSVGTDEDASGEGLDDEMADGAVTSSEALEQGAGTPRPARSLAEAMLSGVQFKRPIQMVLAISRPPQ